MSPDAVVFEPAHFSHVSPSRHSCGKPASGIAKGFFSVILGKV
jgi:hypothetical protein